MDPSNESVRGRKRARSHSPNPTGETERRLKRARSLSPKSSDDYTQPPTKRIRSDSAIAYDEALLSTDESDSEETRADVPETVDEWNANDYFTMENGVQKECKRFETTTNDYQVDFQAFAVNGYEDTVVKLSKILEGVVERVRQDLPNPAASNGRVCITAPRFTHPISTGYGNFNAEITAQKLAELIASKLNSDESLEMMEGFKLNVIATVAPLGGSRKERPGAFINRNIVGVPGWAFCKRSLVDPDFNQKGKSANTCLAKAIVIGKCLADNLDPTRPTKDISLKHSVQYRRLRQANIKPATKLHVDARVPIGPMCGLPEMQKFQQYLSDYQLCVRASSVLGEEIFAGPYKEKQINVFLHEEHFYTIKSMTGFLDRNHFCKQCRKGHTRPEHICGEADCKFCNLADCENTSAEQGKFECLDCNITWKTHGCRVAHKLKMCEMKARCQICRNIVERPKLTPPSAHDCMLNHCRVCRGMKEPGHTCWLQKPKEKPKKEADVEPPKHKYFYGDIEAVCVPRNQPQQPILIGFQDEDGVEQWFSERGCVEDFLTTITEDKQYHGSTFLFHNLSGYDGMHILNACNNLHLKPQPIQKCTRLLTLTLPKQKIRFVDSLLFITSALKDMPKSFGLQDEVGLKGEFPFLVANFDNLYDDIDWPELKMFSPDTRKVADKRKLVSWWTERQQYYENHPDEKFNIFEQMQTYCSQDITILRRSCQVFRQNMMEIFNGEDPFRHITLPSYCNYVYCKHFMPEQSIAALPPQGMGNPGRNFGHTSIIWLEHRRKQLGVQIKHARTAADEVKIGPYWVDGYYEKDGEKYAMDYHGCMYHGHQDCPNHPEYRDPKAVNPHNRCKYVDLAADTEERRLYLEARGYHYEFIYECEFHAQRLADAELGKRYRRMMSAYKRTSPLNPSDSFRGGRTSTVRQYCKPTLEQLLKYLDYTSLYPSVNAGCNGEEYPVGEPIIQLDDFMPIEQVFGLVKCVVQPPDRLFFPVLPIQEDKVLFGLCGKCMKDGATSFCRHTELERRIRGTFVSVELQLAIRLGYKVVEVFELWHWEERTTDLFKSFICRAYREKVEASGWPEGVSTEAEKDAYISNYLAVQGVELRKDRIEKNAGRRTVGKFTVTNLWGFFGKRNNPAQTIYCDDYAHYCKIVLDEDKKVIDSYLAGEGDAATLVLVCEDVRERNDGRTSKVIATFTTAYARCRLYECLAVLKDQVCYMDTDSVIYVTGPGMSDLPTGELMGQLTDEVAKDHGPSAVISAFASCGSKSYTLLIDDSVTGDRLETVLKFKGIRPCVKNAEVLTADNLVEIATKRTEDSAIVHAMKRDKRKATVAFTESSKHIRFTADKRLVTKSFGSYPIGWIATDTEYAELM